jgi:hypothetical protein
LSTDARRQLEDLAETTPVPMDINSSAVDVLDVLDGTMTISISHAGGEFQDLVNDISQDPTVKKRWRD